MSPPFTQFINEHLKRDEECSKSLSLACLTLLYERAKKCPLDDNTFFSMLTKNLGPPSQGDETSPPGKVVWKGWRRISSDILHPLGHAGIKGEEKSVLALAQQRGFDRCPICMQLVIKKAIVTECGHKFCLPCIQDLKLHSTARLSFECPLCRNPTKQIIASSLIYRNVKQFNCPGTYCSVSDMELDEFENHIWFQCNSRQIQCECGEQVEAINWITHEKTFHYPLSQCQCGITLYRKREHTCKYTNIGCEKCEKLVAQKDLVDHLQTSCPFAAECKCCGLPGTMTDITIHQVNCTVENCNLCDEIFRSDKLGQHQSICPNRPFECVIEGCTEKMPFDVLKSHFITDHPVLVDTGIYSEKKNLLYMVIDTKSLPCIGEKIDESEESIKFRYIGWGMRYDEWIPKSSSRILSLENNVDQLLSSRPWSIFPKIFTTGGLGSLIKHNGLSHKDVELLCYLEQTYKESIRGESENLETEEKVYCDT